MVNTYPKFETYEATDGEYRWRLVDTNHRIIADSAEGYVTEQGVHRAIDNVIEACVGINDLGIAH